MMSDERFRAAVERQIRLACQHPNGRNQMPTVQVSAQIDVAVKKALDDHCRRHHVVVSDFIREALVDRLEELEDIEDLKRLRDEPTRPFSEVVAELDLDDRA